MESELRVGENVQRGLLPPELVSPTNYSPQNTPSPYTALTENLPQARIQKSQKNQEKDALSAAIHRSCVP